MAFTSRKNLYVHWLELKPIEARMTEADKAWFRLFLQAYYLQSKAALAQLTQDPDVFKNVWTEALWMSNEGQRNSTRTVIVEDPTTGIKTAVEYTPRAYGSDYTSDDWPGDEQGFCAEDAIIDAIDFQRSQENGKANNTVPPAKPKNSRAQSKSARNSKTHRNDNSLRQGRASLVASGS